MAWKEMSLMSQRKEFVVLALQEDVNIRQLCRRFGISRKTGYKWILRFRQVGETGLHDKSRRPNRSPRQTSTEVESAVLALRDKHVAWGGRKIHNRLLRLGIEKPPSGSTITAILRRHNRIDPAESEKHKACQRFEREEPNRLWQMDFKGHFALEKGRCHPLTALDDHSRFNLCLQACENERGDTVENKLTGIFRVYGLPETLLMDNGSPWGSDDDRGLSWLAAWLIRLGIKVSHGRPYHPQTQGKEERFHRTLKAEVLGQRVFRDLAHCQKHFDEWRMIYNLERPHEALGMKTPAERYRPSLRSFPESLPAIEYGPDDIIRKCQGKGEIYFKNKIFKIGKAFSGYPLAIRPTTEDGIMNVFFCHQKVARINLKDS